MSSKNTRRSFGKGWLLLSLLLVLVLILGLAPLMTAADQGQGGDDPDGLLNVQEETPPPPLFEDLQEQQWYEDHEIERTWQPDYLDLATGDPQGALAHGVWNWPFALDTMGHAIHSYQYYGGAPYFHHGLDIMAPNGTQVYTRSGGQIVNIENYNPGNDLYWEVAVLDPDGYLWQYHHIDKNTIPPYIKDKYAEYQADPANGGFVDPDTHIGNIVYWTVVSFGKRFNHIHLNILGAGGVFVNGFDFHTPLPDYDVPQILGIGLLQGGSVTGGNEASGDYSLYVRARDLVLDDVYWLPPYEVRYRVDGGPETTVWRFDSLPGGADDEAYVNDYYVVPPTCGDYSCRDFYIDLGFIPNSQRVFPSEGGQHNVEVFVRDYVGNEVSQTYNWTVLGPPSGDTVWFDDFETNKGWVTNPSGTDTATTGMWEVGNPEGTDYSGPKQLDSTVSGSKDLVTGRLAGSSVGTYDVDNGVTTARSPAIQLPASGSLTLSFYYYLAHVNNSSADDLLRVKVVGASTQTVFEELGSANNDDAAWEIYNASLDAFAGQTVYLLVEAADNAGGSIVEAALDDVHILVEGGLPTPVPTDTPVPPTPTDTPVPPTPTDTPVPPTPTDTPVPPTPTSTPASCPVFASSDVPKSLPAGVSSTSSTLVVSGSAYIDDLNVNVDMPHQWVGDLSFTLTHQETGTTVTIIDRPGVPASSWGCSADDILATLDDEAGSPIEDQCASSPPAINGTFTPNQPLAAFDGKLADGTWILIVTDAYPSADVGTLNGWNLEICASGTPPTPTPETPTPIPPTPTSIPPTPTPVPGADVVYVSSTTDGTAGGVSFSDEDILAYDTSSATWSMVFDGSDVGLTVDVAAFTFLGDGSILMSTNAAAKVPDVGSVDDSDIVRFVPSALGATTAGTFEIYLDGSDVGLSTSGEDIDALTLLPDGRLVVSLLGSWAAGGLSGQDEDLLLFGPTSLGWSTAGSWAIYSDGSDVGLATSSSEDVYAAWLDGTTNDIYLSTAGSFSVPGASGDGADVFVCHPSSTGTNTGCTFGPGLYWDGSAYGFGGEILDGLYVGGN